jgi:hypothetical protein
MNDAGRRNGSVVPLLSDAIASLSLIQFLLRRESFAMFKFFSKGFDRVSGPSRRPDGLVIATALAALTLPLGGCGGVGSSTGEGTVDLSRAKEAAKSNPDINKAAAALGTNGMGDALKPKQGRR